MYLINLHGFCFCFVFFLLKEGFCLRYVFVTLAYTWFTHMCWLVVEILVVVVVMVALLLLQDVALDFLSC